MDYNSKRILVTGAAGLIGREVCDQLSKFNCSVTGVDNNWRYKDYTPSNCYYINSNLDEFINTCQEQFDIVFHMAAVNGTSNFYTDPNHTLSNNVQSDLLTFNFANKQKAKLIYASSSEVVSDSTEVPTSEETTIIINDIHNPRWSYRLPKILSENYLTNSNLDYVIVRFFNVYSEHSHAGHFVHDIVKKIKQNDFSLIGADETRSFCYVKDAVDALIYISLTVSKDLVNIGNTEEIKIIDAAEIIADALGYNNISWNLVDNRSGSVKRRCPDITKLKNIYSQYNPRSFKDVLGSIKDKL